MKCPRRKSIEAQIYWAKGDLADARHKLRRNQDDPDRAEHFADQIQAIKAHLKEHEIELAAHQADQHPEPPGATPSPFRPRLHDDDKSALLAMLADGIPRGEIAEAFGITPSTVQYYAQRAGYSRSALPPPEDLAAMLSGGQTVEQLANKYAATVNAVTLRVTRGGYSTTTGQPLERRVEGLPALGHLFEFPPWFERAICAQTDPEAFYPEKGGSTKEAKSVCARCTVSAECLDYALDNHERFGIWGGLSERERRKLALQRGQETGS